MSDRQTTIGKYQIIREIARSNDIVYEAYDPIMNRRVALKELAMPGGMTDPQKEDRVRRFIREAKAAGSLNHPNIVTIYECGEEGGKHFIAMEFLDGHTLRNELDTQGFLPPVKAFSIITEVLSGLEYAHQNGVIHRDIKPENIQLLPDGRVKLTDFGIARLTFEPNLTMDGQVFGTPSYMSPEQVVGKEIDVRSDLFSVGVILYEMMSGEKPFKGDSVVSITYAIMNTQPTQPNQANHTVWQLLSRALEKSSQLRYANATEMLGAASAAAKSLTETVLGPIPAAQTGGYAPLQPAALVAPPVNNPFMGSSTFGAMAAAPAVYPYDPYQPQPGSPGVAPLQQPYGYNQGHVPAPVYYPPPPRQPFITPETKSFLGRLFMVVVVLGTLIGLVMAGVWALGVAYERSQNQDRDAYFRRELEVQDKKLPVDDRIQLRQQTIPKLADQVSIKEEKRKLAADFQSKGRESMRQGDFISASAFFEEGLENDPLSAGINYDLGSLYVKRAEDEKDFSQRLILLDLAANNIANAAQNAENQIQRTQFADAAARLFYKVAVAMMQSGERQGARTRLFKARRIAAPGSQIALDVQSTLERLTN